MNQQSVEVGIIKGPVSLLNSTQVNFRSTKQPSSYRVNHWFHKVFHIEKCLTIGVSTIAMLTRMKAESDRDYKVSIRVPLLLALPVPNDRSHPDLPFPLSLTIVN